MRYKFSLKPEIKSTVEWELSSYRDDKRQLEKVKRDLIPSPVQGYSLTAGVDGGEAKRTTEEVTMRVISAPYIRRLEISVEAIERALTRFDDIDMKLIDLIYWRKEYTPEGAGMIVGMQKSAVYQRLNKILGCVAFEMGYVSER
jgi:RinA family phage transcriptional activator